MVRDADSGTVLYQAHAQQRLAPASNMKMFTSLAAFGVLGADYRFETRLLTTGEQRGDTLQGDLYLQGSGDPTLHPDDLDTFAATLAQRGIRQIHGRLIPTPARSIKRPSAPAGAGTTNPSLSARRSRR